MLAGREHFLRAAAVNGLYLLPGFPDRGSELLKSDR